MTDRIPNSVILAMAEAAWQAEDQPKVGEIKAALRAAEAHDPPFKLIGREPTEAMKDIDWAVRGQPIDKLFPRLWDAAPSAGEKP